MKNRKLELKKFIVSSLGQNLSKIFGGSNNNHNDDDCQGGQSDGGGVNSSIPCLRTNG